MVRIKLKNPNSFEKKNIYMGLAKNNAIIQITNNKIPINKMLRYKEES